MMHFIRKSASIVGTVALLAAPLASHAAPISSVFNAGDLIKGASNSTVYYFAPTGKRYVFPNEKTYFTWYTDFSKVITIPDSHLSTIPLGGNVTYKPGRKMVKITTDPKVYVVDQGGVLRWVKTEQLAQTLYNINWKQQIDDVPDAFFVNYRVGTPIDMAADFKPADVMVGTPDIMTDKQMDKNKITITIGNYQNSGFVPSTVTVKVGTEITWTNNDITAHTVVGTGGIDSGNVDPSKTYAKVFNTVGSFDYHCGIHPVTQGTINVVR